MKKRGRKKLICMMLVLMMSLIQMYSIAANAADISDLASESRLSIVLTLGADLSEDQKSQVLQYFGIEITQVTVVTITNQDEHDKLGSLISAEQIGTHTYSCALVNPTNAGGIQVKTANMNYVTSNMIAGQLSTSGVYNCEVLTAAPFEVSGTGALTGVMMAYEEASGVQLDEEKKELANVELVTTGTIADTVGQDQATLIVNDIKIHIVRDQISEEQEVRDVVDNVVQVTETAAAEAAAVQGLQAPARLGEVEHTQLYDFSCKFSQMEYDYAQMQPTLERVTHNITTSTGIDDPITDTFTTITEEQVLPSNSILLGTNDEIWGDDAIINATNSIAVSDRPAEPINVYTGEVTLNSAGGVKADEFISGTNIIAYKDINGSYALMDLNGKMLTEPIYTRDIYGRYGYIEAQLNDGSGKVGVLAPDGSVVVDFQYDAVQVAGNMWALGCVLTGGATEDNYDYTDYENYYLIDHVDVYYIGMEGTKCVGQLTRDGFSDVYCCADYINVQDRSGVVTTYDSSFNAVQTSEQLYDFGTYDYDNSLEESLESKTGYYVGSFYGKYAQYYGDSGKGIMDRYGNIIVPAQFASFDIDASGENYESGGYFASIGDTQIQFITAGGNVTGSFNYGYDNVDSISSYGMTARVKKADGGYILLSADGVETDLGTAYDYMSVLKESEGLLWEGQKDGGYDLIDWHGNVLISGSSGFSLSANGSYLISQEGYTSSTLYMINDAEPVDLANSAGGAQEMVIETVEGSSLEAYTGEPVVEKAGTLLSESFIDGSDLLVATNDGWKYAIMDVTDRQLTKPQFDRYVECDDGWLLVTDAETQKQGVLSQSAQVVVPCEYDKVDVLDTKWIIAYSFQPGTESDYDFENYMDESYYQIATAKIFYINGDAVSSVEITRDQLADAEAEGDYLNIEDRTTGLTTTYDGTFSPVASTDYVSDFGDFSYEMVRYHQMADKIAHDVRTFGDDGYVEAYDYDGENFFYGIVDYNGEEIIPFEYDRINYIYSSGQRYFNNRGYFCVEKDEMIGYVKKGGEISCEIKYASDNFYNYGMSGVYQQDDGTYLIVSADGVESGPYEDSPRAGVRGLLYRVYNDDYEYVIVDWHGNEIVNGAESCSFSESGKYILIQMDYDGPVELYTIDGAEIVGAAGNAAAPEDGQEAPESEGAAGADETEAAAPQSGGDAAQTEGAAPAEDTAPAENDAQTEAAAQTEDAAPAEDTAQTEDAAPAEDTAPAEDGTQAAGSAEEISQLLLSASALVQVDLAANKAAVGELLKQAQAKAETDYPSAAAIIGSVVTLLDSESTDAASVTTLIDSAITLLK